MSHEHEWEVAYEHENDNGFHEVGLYCFGCEGTDVLLLEPLPTAEQMALFPT